MCHLCATLRRWTIILNRTSIWWSAWTRRVRRQTGSPQSLSYQPGLDQPVFSLTNGTSPRHDRSTVLVIGDLHSPHSPLTKSFAVRAGHARARLIGLASVDPAPPPRRLTHPPLFRPNRNLLLVTTSSNHFPTSLYHFPFTLAPNYPQMSALSAYLAHTFLLVQHSVFFCFCVSQTQPTAPHHGSSPHVYQ